MTPRRTLILFLKEPQPGRVKTRLAQDIGRVRAAGWFRRQAMRLIREVGQDRRWDTVLALAPDGAVGSKVFPGALPRMGQGRGDLGTRMTRALRRVGPGPAVLIGGDIPGVDRGAVAEAFAALGRANTVFGPATDGGYWLIGARHPAALPQFWLDGVRWSDPETLSDSLRAAEALGPVARIRTLGDVDRATDLWQSPVWA